MAVVLARVDNRLVHGQILEAWVPHLRVDAIAVVDRLLVDDPLQRVLIEALAHGALEIRVTTPEQAARTLAGEWAGRRVLVLFPDIERAVEALEAGVEFDRLNLGNVHPGAETRSLTPSVHVTVDDERRLGNLLARGVELEARAVPLGRSPDLRARLTADGRR